MADLLTKYATLAIAMGLNIKKGQSVYINTPVEAYDFARKLGEVAYQTGAGHVHINYQDMCLNKNMYIYETVESLSYLPKWKQEYFKEIVDSDACVISIASPNPEGLKGADPNKIAIATKKTNEILSFYSEHLMASKTQWCVVAYPNNTWAKKIFPEKSEKVAFNSLLKAIYKACRINTKTNPADEWNQHLENLENYANKLNEYNFDYLHFKNSIGTDLKVHLVNNHIWAGGKEKSMKGTWFVPNIPTEEVFTMPSRTKVEGIVKSTKPLCYHGNIIDEFSLEFKNGEVTSFDAKVGYEFLESLLKFDEGSRHIGEVALISNNTPISQMNILFYNTLFDENASCHLALGDAYPMNVKDGVNMSSEELKAADANSSAQHVDFMFGSPDMEIVGVKKDGTKVDIFKKGNFIF